MPKTQIVVDRGEYGFEPLIVVFAQSVSQSPWWLYYTLIQGHNSWDTLGVDDPDFFCVYNFATKKIVWMLSQNPARGGHIFRIHDDVKARIKKRDDASAFVTSTGGHPGKDGVHQCVTEPASGTGKWDRAKRVASSAVPCGDKTDLRIDSQNLGFQWVLPDHLKYESKKEIQWAGPK